MMKLYDEIGEWWPLFSAPEAEFFTEIFEKHSPVSPKSLLELGSGGGNNASFLKQSFDM